MGLQCTVYMYSYFFSIIILKNLDIVWILYENVC